MFEEFLNPVSEELQSFAFSQDQFSVGHHVSFYFDEENQTSPLKIAILGLKEKSEDYDVDFNLIRKELYQLKVGDWTSKIIDFGDIEAGATFEDSCFAFQKVHQALLKRGFKVIVLGHLPEFTYFQYRSFDSVKTNVNLSCFDFKFRFGDESELLNANNFLSKIISQPPHNLFEYTHFGHQAYYVAQAELDLIEHLNFDVIRLGELMKSIKKVEPFTRETDLVALDLACIQASDFSSTPTPLPNGFNAREICAITRYIGTSHTVQSIYLYHYIERYKMADHLLLTQMIWYFIDGQNHKPLLVDFEDELHFEKIHVPTVEQDLVFYHNLYSDQWWIEIKNLNDHSPEGVHIVPCHKKDYSQAIRGEVPNRFWKSFKKFY
ncbi:arginase family protein [Vaginella massiliensis]|uniref:arginase family protein n=1 Tax=Vaginella massiliensis TaxID=1816680 RepID=UPI0008392F86|nr:arginase family protein [Vaginella massiliensis]